MADLRAAARKGRKKAKHKGSIENLISSLRDQIRQLKAELAVRDNMGNDVLRILREATGKRDFHSEMEAAEWAAKMLADARLDSARLDFSIDNFELINIDGWSDYADFSAIDLGPEEKEKDEIRKAWRKYLDAEIKEAK